MKSLTVFLVAALTSMTVFAGFRGYQDSTDLKNFDAFKCSTGLSCTRSFGKMVVTSSPTLTGPITLESAETISNVTDDTVKITSNDEAINLLLMGFEAKAATLSLWADEGDDNADKFSFSVSTADVLTINNNATQLFAISSAGALTLPDGEILTNASDGLTLLGDDNDTVFNVTGFEAKVATLQLWADEGDDAADKYSLTADASDVLTLKNNTTALLAFSSAGVQTLADSETFTDASDVITFGFDDAAANIKVNAFEATDSNLILQADESDDNGDDWQLSSVASGNAFTISNDTSGSQVAKFSLSTGGAVSSIVSLTGNGTGVDVGFLKSQITSTTTTLTIAQCGSTIVNDSADVLTLPEASTALGCRYTFVVANASNLDINPNDATDLILPFHLYESTAIAPSAGDAIRSATLGASITIEAVGANAWAVVSVVDTWADIN